MALDLEEQDQLDALRTWWKSHGNLVLGIAALAVVAIVGYQGWNQYQKRQSEAASTKFIELGDTSPTDVKTVQALAGEIMDKYPSTPYAARAALLAAKVNYDADDVDSARAQTEWAYRNAKEDAVRTVAQLQLAAILLDQKDYDGALKLLNDKHESSFDGLFLDLKGDVLAAQGSAEEARAAYQDALKHFDFGSRYSQYTKYKLEALGE
ncbi:MAG TPA: tetratricopeptide repeat protein [Methylophilaceae bacterium]|jgi:predicted negative regulator of RcsB-dependent stress response